MNNTIESNNYEPTALPQVLGASGVAGFLAVGLANRGIDLVALTTYPLAGFVSGTIVGAGVDWAIQTGHSLVNRNR